MAIDNNLQLIFDIVIFAMLNVQRVFGYFNDMSNHWRRQSSLKGPLSATSVSTPLVNIKKNQGKSSFLMGNFTISSISMAIFNSFLYVYQAG